MGKHLLNSQDSKEWMLGRWCMESINM